LRVRLMDKGKLNSISRRELLTLSWLSGDEIPVIDTSRCRGYEDCGLCLAGCPLDAVEVGGDKVAIDSTRCSGCGACVEVCPSRAVVYPGFSSEEMDRKLSDLLITQDMFIQCRIIAITCQSCLPDGHYKGMLSLSVPCLAMVSPCLMLRAFDRGASGLAVITGGADCHASYDVTHLQDKVHFVKELFSRWNIEPERISIFNVADESTSGEFGRKVAGLGPTPLGALPPSAVPDEDLRLPALIKGINDKLGGASSGAVIATAVSFGRVTVDHSRCTGCSLCALECPTGALDMSPTGESDTYQLLFKHEDCVACGRCVEVCPEKCLSLERVLELDKLGAPATAIFEDTVVRCAECGQPVGSRAMVDSIKARLIAAGQSLSAELELCPSCKVKAQSNFWEPIAG